MIWIEEKDKLERLINVEKKSYEEIARNYGVCGNTIKKQAKNLGIKLSPRRVKNPKETFNKGVVLKPIRKKKNATNKIVTVDVAFAKKNIGKNNKNIGEKGEMIAIGELAKFDIDVLKPMGDNLPFDFVVYYGDNFYKCQVKSSNSLTENGSVAFNISTNNWYAKTIHKYNPNEVDVYIFCDLEHIFLFRYDEVETGRVVTLRYDLPKNGQTEKIRFAGDYIIGLERIKKVFSK
jgi:hypothetical protein